MRRAHPRSSALGGRRPCTVVSAVSGVRSRNTGTFVLKCEFFNTFHPPPQLSEGELGQEGARMETWGAVGRVGAVPMGQGTGERVGAAGTCFTLAVDARQRVSE